MKTKKPKKKRKFTEHLLSLNRDKAMTVLLPISVITARDGNETIVLFIFICSYPQSRFASKKLPRKKKHKNEME